MHKRADRSLISSPSIGVIGGKAGEWGHCMGFVCVAGGWLHGGIAVTGVRHGKCFSSFGLLSFSVS